MNPIEVNNVTKRYGDFTAVDGVSFSVDPGTIFGLLGPNGAGKTTTIRMIMNITVPDSGSITVLGKPSTEGGGKLIGYLPEERGLYRKMKVIDHLVFLGEIRGLPVAEAKKRSGEWLERLSLVDWRNRKVEELSKGMQQKLQFIGCVIHEPKVLILDEPFSGLDPVNARVFKDLFVEMRQQGKTVVLSTHVMEQAEKLCDEIALINRSRLVLEGPIAQIKKQYSGNRMVLQGSGDSSRLGDIGGVRAVHHRDGQVEVELDQEMERGQFLRSASQIFDIDSVVPHEASLDEIFVQVVTASGGTVPVEEEKP
jgi:ABC-2 type transport system ATP-binding protein